MFLRGANRDLLDENSTDLCDIFEEDCESVRAFL